jgi:chondroitin 4-sulfotransferase 11
MVQNRALYFGRCFFCTSGLGFLKSCVHCAGLILIDIRQTRFEAITFRKLLRDFELLIPELHRSKLLILRRRKLWRKAGIVFIHVPKAAGTSVSHALYGQFTGHIPARHVLALAPGIVGELPVFGVVRNPFSRIYSAYCFAVAGAGLGAGPKAGMYKPDRYKGPAFRSFDSFLVEWLVNQDIEKIDYVFRAQTYYTHSSDMVQIPQFVGRVEDMQKVESFVNSATGNQVSFEHHNRSGNGESYRDKYSQTGKDIVATLYKSDLDAYGYTF